MGSERTQGQELEKGIQEREVKDPYRRVDSKTRPQADTGLARGRDCVPPTPPRRIPIENRDQEPESDPPERRVCNSTAFPAMRSSGERTRDEQKRQVYGRQGERPEFWRHWGVWGDRSPRSYALPFVLPFQANTGPLRGFEGDLRTFPLPERPLFLLARLPQSPRPLSSTAPQTLPAQGLHPVCRTTLTEGADPPRGSFDPAHQSLGEASAAFAVLETGLFPPGTTLPAGPFEAQGLRLLDGKGSHGVPHRGQDTRWP